jgi:hypothetical protein
MAGRVGRGVIEVGAQQLAKEQLEQAAKQEARAVAKSILEKDAVGLARHVVADAGGRKVGQLGLQELDGLRRNIGQEAIGKAGKKGGGGVEKHLVKEQRTALGKLGKEQAAEYEKLMQKVEDLAEPEIAAIQRAEQRVGRETLAMAKEIPEEGIRRQILQNVVEMQEAGRRAAKANAPIARAAEQELKQQLKNAEKQQMREILAKQFPKGGR